MTAPALYPCTPIMLIRNRTHLDSAVLSELFHAVAVGRPHEGLRVSVRYSRGAAFSGACYYATGRIFINLGRRNCYPYRLTAHLARARSDPHGWSRELFTVELADAYQLALFIFAHELYHWLVKRAGRNVRQKEARCDRFAARTLVDRWGCPVHDSKGRLVDRALWDFQDVEGFVAADRLVTQPMA